MPTDPDARRQLRPSENHAMTPESYFLRNLPIARRVVAALNEEHLSVLNSTARPMRVTLNLDGTFQDILPQPALPEAERAAEASGLLVRGLTSYVQGDDATAAACVRRVLGVLEERTKLLMVEVPRV